MRDPAKPYPHDRFLAATVLRLIPHWVLPNHVTILRFLATPFVVWLVAAEHLAWGIVAFLLVAFTDAIDGAMARTRNQITAWGSLFDPVADKILIGSMVVVIVFEYVNWMLGLTVIILEAMALVGGYIRLRRGHTVQANMWGKLKMILECLGVTLLLTAVASGVQLFVPVSMGVFALAIIFAVVSLVTHGI